MKSEVSQNKISFKKLRLSEACLKTQRKCNNLMKSYSEMLLFTTSIKNVEDPDVVEYMKIRRKLALDCLNENVD